MHKRCSSPTSQAWDRYGGRGITVCDRWRSFASFLSDVGPRPSPDHSIDRWPDPNGGYEPGNVRWATAKEQARNTRRNRYLEHEGKTLLLVEWSEKTGISAMLIRERLRNGWTVADTLTRPVRRRSRQRGPITHDGRTMPATAWGREVGIAGSVISDRLSRGWSTAAAITRPARQTRRRAA